MKPNKNIKAPELMYVYESYYPLRKQIKKHILYYVRKIRKDVC